MKNTSKSQRNINNSIKDINKSQRDIRLEDVALETYNNPGIETIPFLLKKWEKGEGYIPSAGDMELLVIRNSENTPRIIEHRWYTSTLSAKNGNTLKIILPYDQDKKLTAASKYGLGLIKSQTKLLTYDYPQCNRRGVALNNGGWDFLSRFGDSDGVYTFNCKNLILAKYLPEDEAMDNELLLTILGHPDYVDTKFARPISEIEEIVKTPYDKARKNGESNPLFNYLHFGPTLGNECILNTCSISLSEDDILGYSNSSDLESAGSPYAFIRPDKLKENLKNLEGILNPEIFKSINGILNERNELAKELDNSVLATKEIYDKMIKSGYIASANEEQIESIFNKMIAKFKK